MTAQWPTAELDPIRRLRVLAAGIPGAVLVERVIPAPSDVVWALAEDIEHTVSRTQPHVTKVRITDRQGEHLVVDVRGHLGIRARMDAVMRPGWCVMQSRFLRVGMAAMSEDGGTRFGRLVALRLPGAALLSPLIDWLISRNLAAELRRLERVVLTPARLD